VIQLFDLGPNIVACSVSGKVAREDLDTLSREIDRHAATGERFRVYAEIGDLSLMNLISLSQDLKSWSHRKDLVHQLERAAVVTDSALVRQGMQFRDRVPGTVDIQLFAASDKERAREWVAA
jgi:hypothetical protein